MQHFTDEIALKQAAKYNREEEYKKLRRKGRNIVEAMLESNLFDEEFLNEYSGYTLKKETLKERLSLLFNHDR